MTHRFRNVVLALASTSLINAAASTPADDVPRPELLPPAGISTVQAVNSTAASRALAADLVPVTHDAPCAGGQPHPVINSMEVSEIDRATGAYTLTITHENTHTMTLNGDLLCRVGGRECVNPFVWNMSKACKTEGETLTVVAVGGWLGYEGCTVTQERTVPAIDPKPVISAIAIGGGAVGFNFEFPYAPLDRNITMELLRTAEHDPVVRSISSPYLAAKGRTGSQHGDRHVTMKITATACSNPNLQSVKYVPLPAGDNNCDEDCNDNPCPSCVGSPVKTSSGNLRYTEIDPIPSVPFLPMKRISSSRNRARSLFGYYWTSPFDAWLRAANGIVTLMTEDAAYYVFELGTDGRWIQRAGSGVEATTLEVDATTGWWRHRNERDGIERYFDGSGKPVRYSEIRTGRYVDITYDAAGLPVRLSDSWGTLAWTITTDPSARIITTISIEGTAGLTWTYGYQIYNGSFLHTVASPAGRWRKYNNRVVDGLRIESLESVEDGAGNVIERHTYDGQRRSISSFGPQGDIQSITYDHGGREEGDMMRVITYPDGRVEQHYIRYAGSAFRTIEVSGGCPSCRSAGEAVTVRDSFGNIVRRQDARGYVTESTYSPRGRVLLSETAPLRPAACDPETDPARCRMTTAELAQAALVPTPQSVTTSYEYADPVWPDKPTAIVTPSVVIPGESRRESYTYHPVTGAVASATTAAPVPGADSGDGRDAPAPMLRTTTTLFYSNGGATTCEDGRDVCEGGDTGSRPAFDPGGAFQSAWLDLPQPLHFRKSVQGPLGELTSFVYYPLDASVPALLRGRLAAVRNAAGHVTRYETYDIFGNTTRIVDPNGVATEMTYDALGRLVTSTLKGVAGCDTTRDPLCATDLVTTRTYAGTGPLDSETRPDGSVTKYTYDARSRVKTISRGPSATDLRERIDYTYDPVTAQKTLERTLAFENGGWRETRRQSFAYDSQGRLATITHADGASAAYSYEAGGQIASVRDENHTSPNTFYAYDPAGQLTTVTHTLATAPGYGGGGTTCEDGRDTCDDGGDTSPAGPIATRYAHDIHANLASVTDPNGNVTTYTYDDFGRMVSQSSPVTGVTAYSYDIAGNLISTTDANGATTTRSYDVLGRVVSATSTRGTESEHVSWAYDLGSASDGGSGTFGIGRLSSVTDPTGSTRYSYDRRGLVIAEAKTIGGATYATGFGYDASGNRARLDHPSGASIAFGHDFAGRPVSASRGGVPLVTSVKYLPFGPATEVVYGNGTRRRRPHDARYRPLANTLDAGGEPLASYAYAYDLAGNIIRIDDLLDPAYNRSFGYDDLNRLVTANGPWGAGSFAYDAMGNMTTRTFGDGRSASFAYQGTTPKIARVSEAGAGRSVTYDAAGNEIAIRTLAYDDRSGGEIVAGESLSVYTPRNHLRRQNGITYAYDGRGVRTLAIRPPSVASLTVTPTTIDGGSSASGAVTLTSPAPAEAIVIALASSSAAVTVPPSVTIGAGQVAATFTATTQNVAQQTSATVTASMTGSSRTVTVTVMPSVQIAEMRLSHESVVGGTSASGTISVNGAIPEGGVAIALASSHSAVLVPAQVTIDGGREFARFPITTTSVTSPVTATIVATLGSSTAEATVTVLPLTMTLAFTPSPMYGGVAATGEITLSAPAPTGGATVTLASTYEGVVLPPTVAIAEGAQSATFAVSASPVENDTAVQVRATYGASEAWATLHIAPPLLTDLTVTPATIVGSEPLTAVVSVNAPAAEEGAGVPIETSHPELVTSPARAMVPAGATTGTTELATDWVATTTPVVVSATRHGVTRSTTVTLEPPPVTLSSFSIAPASLVGTNDATGTVVLTGAALEGGLEIELTTSNRDVAAPPPSVLIPAGAIQASFAIPTTFVGSTTAVTISAWHATITKEVVLTVNPPGGNYVAALDVRPAFIVAGTSASGTVTLAAPSAGNSDVLLASSAPSIVSVPSSIRITATKLAASFTVTTTAVTAPVSVTITARFGGVIQRKRVIVAPENSVALSALSATPDRVVSESATTGIVTLTAAAPYGGADVTVEPNRRNIVTVPPIVTVPEGATSATFTIAADRLNASKERSVDIVATYNGVSATATVTVLPKPAASATPQPVVQCASLALVPCLTTNALSITTHETDDRDPAPPSDGERQYFLYTPELNLLAETTSSTATNPPLAYEYIWFAGEPLAQVNIATGEIHYYFNDHLGTPILQTDESARVVWQAEYDPYGGIHAIRRGEDKHQPLRLPGQEADSATEAAYNIHRWYRSAWGRYTQGDPLEELRASEPNLYRYARANPTTFTDPMGLWAIDKSCDECPGGYCFGGKKAVQDGVNVACGKFLKKPKCASFIENLQFANTMDTGQVEPLGPCMRRLCDSDNKIYCAQNTNPQAPGACAKANPGGAITLMCGAGTGNCYFDQGAGWSHTIFHEMVHVCGLTDIKSESYGTGPYSKLFQKIMWTCAGVPN